MAACLQPVSNQVASHGMANGSSSTRGALQPCVHFGSSPSSLCPALCHPPFQAPFRLRRTATSCSATPVLASTTRAPATVASQRPLAAAAALAGAAGAARGDLANSPPLGSVMDASTARHMIPSAGPQAFLHFSF